MTKRIFPILLLGLASRAADDGSAILENQDVGRVAFARDLNVTTGLVSQWERGERHPQGASLKLLALVAQKGLNGVA